MSLQRSEIEEWATAYIDATLSPDQLKPGYELWWAIERFILNAHDPSKAEDCWSAILEVLSRNPPQSVLDVLAAGPLEDLISYHGDAFIDRIELMARQEPAFRLLLRGVWESGPPELWARVQLAQAYHKA
jgi:hypothetical protein